MHTGQLNSSGGNVLPLSSIETSEHQQQLNSTRLIPHFPPHFSICLLIFPKIFSSIHFDEFRLEVEEKQEINGKFVYNVGTGEWVSVAVDLQLSRLLIVKNLSRERGKLPTTQVQIGSLVKFMLTSHAYPRAISCTILSFF